jgi:hypothetical protein
MKVLKCLILLPILLFNLRSSAQVAIAVEGMNVLFPSVENPITLVASDIPDSNLLLIPSVGEIHRRKEVGQYGWTICHRDTNFATLTIRDQRNDSLLQVLVFRVKPVPIPTPMVGPKSKGMPRGEFIRNGGLALVLTHFDFDLRCDVEYFDVQYIAAGMDAVIKRNKGARWNSEVVDLINKGKPGDQYIFYHITYRCGCDPMIRHHSEELSYFIK